jgi:hypothetical protein
MKPASIYESPAIQQKIAEQRAQLAARGIHGPRVHIGRSIIAKPAHIPRDQEWLQRVFLG